MTLKYYKDIRQPDGSFKKQETDINGSPIIIPGKKFDEGKLRYDLLDPMFEDAVADILSYGAVKYGSNNWQGVEPFNDRYYAALRRHLSAWRSGEKIDPESGKPHLAHCAANIYFLMWKETQTKE